MTSDILSLSKDKTEKLEKEKNEVTSKIKDLEKSYSSGDMIDEEYDELRRPLDEELKRLNGKDLENTIPLRAEGEKDNTKSSTWSTIILFLSTGIIGGFILALLGYVVTKILKFIFPRTMRVGFNNVDITNYGWRGVAVWIFVFTIFVFGLWIWLLYSGEPFEKDIASNILRVVFGGILLLFCYAGIKQFEPPTKNI
ncbi:Uncharacterised protein [uncultured archaeon]|nr:Uncharacterised protein [uncultured archaeon]